MSDFTTIRKELLEVLIDLEALRPFVDPSNSDRGEFNCAWDEAYIRAKKLAEAYVTTSVKV